MKTTEPKKTVRLYRVWNDYSGMLHIGSGEATETPKGYTLSERTQEMGFELRISKENACLTPADAKERALQQWGARVAHLQAELKRAEGWLARCEKLTA